MQDPEVNHNYNKKRKLERTSDVKLYEDTVIELKKIREGVSSIAQSLSDISNYMSILVKK